MFGNLYIIFSLNLRVYMILCTTESLASPLPLAKFCHSLRGRINKRVGAKLEK